MSEFFQSGLHPDADQLNAFVEHVLPPHEQQQVLAHLATCTDCRAVVSVALPIEETAPLPQLEPARKPWFSGWNLLWPAAAALAALLPVALYLRSNSFNSRKQASLEQLAASHPPTPIAPSASLQATKPTEPQTESKAIGEHANLVDKAAPRHAPLPNQNALASAPAEPSVEMRDVANLPLSGRNVAPSGLGIPGSSASASAPREKTQDRLLAGAIGGPLITGQAAAPSARASSTTTAVAVSGASVVPPAPVANNFTLSALKTLAPSPLPSGLPALSTTSTGQVMIALDTRNTLFLSNNSGRVWRTIPAQWKGRAVKVVLASDAARAQIHGVMGGISGRALAPMTVDSAAQSSASAWNSSVTGTVTDPTGASIPKASVAVINSATQTTQTVQSDAAGHYAIHGLAPGSYQLEAFAPGFKTLQQPVNLAAAQQNVANLKLQIGAVTESVTVQSENAIALDGEPIAKKISHAPFAMSQPAPLFEITTDTGERWISLDGQTWTKK